MPSLPALRPTAPVGSPCIMPGCSAISLADCTSCRTAAYCGAGCAAAHRPAHGDDCGRCAAEVEAAAPAQPGVTAAAAVVAPRAPLQLTPLAEAAAPTLSSPATARRPPGLPDVPPRDSMLPPHLPPLLQPPPPPLLQPSLLLPLPPALLPSLPLYLSLLPAQAPPLLQPAGVSLDGLLLHAAALVLPLAVPLSQSTAVGEVALLLAVHGRDAPQLQSPPFYAALGREARIYGAVCDAHIASLQPLLTRVEERVRQVFAAALLHVAGRGYRVAVERGGSLASGLGRPGSDFDFSVHLLDHGGGLVGDEHAQSLWHLLTSGTPFASGLPGCSITRGLVPRVTFTEDGGPYGMEGSISLARCAAATIGAAVSFALGHTSTAELGEKVRSKYKSIEQRACDAVGRVDSCFPSRVATDVTLVTREHGGEAMRCLIDAAVRYHGELFPIVYRCIREMMSAGARAAAAPSPPRSPSSAVIAMMVSAVLLERRAFFNHSLRAQLNDGDVGAAVMCVLLDLSGEGSDARIFFAAGDPGYGGGGTAAGRAAAVAGELGVALPQLRAGGAVLLTTCDFPARTRAFQVEAYGSVQLAARRALDHLSVAPMPPGSVNFGEALVPLLTSVAPSLAALRAPRDRRRQRGGRRSGGGGGGIGGRDRKSVV